jgi:hypothetical protein
MKGLTHLDDIKQKELILVMLPYQLVPFVLYHPNEVDLIYVIFIQER